MSKKVPEIRYTDHLKRRLQIRDIPEKWPREIVQAANIYYHDNETNNLIAIGKRWHEDRERDFLVAFNETEEGIEIITIHPLKEGQKENRIKQGRWVKHERKQ